ncbi:MAG: tetratricopeptide repeat protein, partial [Candidatus Latescibacterota bacterium]|nr:tetratricopeptide repeat protein [Candidatus Latescibacterota bacterium]
LCNIAHVETVQWISALEYPFAVLNISCTLCVYASYIEGRRRALLLFFYGAVLVCALTHFVSVLVLPLCLLWGWWRGGAIVERAKELAPLLLLLPPVLFFVFGLTGSHTTTSAALHASLNQSVVLLFTDSTGSFFWLLGRLLSLAHWVPVVPGERAMVELWLGGVVLLLLLWGVWKGRTEVQIWGLWTLLFTVPFVPATAVHPSIARYVYLATAGSSFLIAWALLRGSRGLGRSGPYVGGAVLLGLLVSSYMAEDRIANLTRYNTGRFFVGHADPRVGMSLIDQALEIDRSLIPVAEAHFYLLDGALRAGVDYEEILRRGLHELPENKDLRLAAQLSAQFAGMAEGDDLARLHAEYATGEYVDSDFLQMTSILSQHFGAWYSKRGDNDGAIRSYRLSLRADPQNINTARRLIKKMLLQGNYSDAEKTVEALKFHQTENPHLLFLAALSYQYAGRSQDALAIVRRAQQLTPSANLHILEGDLLLEKGLMTEAEAAYRRAIAAESTSPEPFLNIAHIYRQEGRVDLALKTLEDAPPPMQKHAIIQNNLGHLYYGEGRVEDAVAAYQRAVAIDPNYILAFSNLGTAFRSLGRFGESEQAYRRALALDQNNSPTHTKLGSLLFVQGKYREAIGHYSIALERDPNATAQFNLGLAHMAQGDFATARRVYAQGIARFGAEEAQRIGAVGSLRALLAKSPSASEIRQLLDEFWPQ